VNIVAWSKAHVLSKDYFRAIEDEKGAQIAFDMENAINAIIMISDRSKEAAYKRCARALSKMYFYMIGKNEFTFTTRQGKKVIWSTYKDFTDYMESGKNFKTFNELYDFMNCICGLEYFKSWRKQAIKC